jgi:hypothetical protein
MEESMNYLEPPPRGSVSGRGVTILMIIMKSGLL